MEGSAEIEIIDSNRTDSGKTSRVESFWKELAILWVMQTRGEKA
jgi:hypothetical protein